MVGLPGHTVSGCTSETTKSFSVFLLYFTKTTLRTQESTCVTEFDTDLLSTSRQGETKCLNRIMENTKQLTVYECFEKKEADP